MPFFIEVGTCDFDTLDQLARNGWSGIMVEPIVQYLDRLPRRESVRYENVAISDVGGRVDVHYIDPEEIQDEEDGWMKGINCIDGASGPLRLNRHLERFRNCRVANVEAMTLNALCEKHGVTEVDLLKIDTEGHDFVVLSTIDLRKIDVRMIKVEHKHADKELIVAHLRDHGYIVWVETDDIYAVR
jgi:FkbM family methyltransferase